MRCPFCIAPLERISYKGIELDRCFRCDGLWFDEDELRKAKDANDEFLRWIDIDLWKHDEQFQIHKGLKTCPKDGVPLYRVRYGDSEIEVDLCNICKGIWLDHHEFREIIDYLHQKLGRETIFGYLKDSFEEFAEIFTGPEPVVSEFKDFLVVQKLLFYRLFSRFPFLAKLIGQLP